MARIHLRSVICAAAFVAVVAGSAFAGQEPYVAAVGNDTAIPNFYISPKLKQFTHNVSDPIETNFTDRGWRSPAPEVCSVDYGVQSTGAPGADVNVNSMLPAGTAGTYTWVVALPKDPRGNINLLFQCGILKPNALALEGPDAILTCAGETGENPDVNCTRTLDVPDVNPVNNGALPQLTVTASDRTGAFPLFNMTAYKNPSGYALAVPIANDADMQVLDGTAGARIALKACMPKTVFMKIPVTGQVNVLTQTETDLVGGDLLTVSLAFPRTHTMDVFCHQHSVKVVGNGEPDFFLPRISGLGPIIIYGARDFP